MRLRAAALLFFFSAVTPLLGQTLEIHTINVAWGGSVLIVGPDGTTVLLEAGETGMGTNEVVPYLQSVGILAADGLDYMVAGHQHCDHLGGLDEVINAGYDVHTKNYYNGSSTTSSCVTGWNTAAATTTAGSPVSMPVGTVINLGSGATLTCIARNGSIIGGGSVSVSNENDRSIALLLQYGAFEYLWASDLGGGSDACTGRSTSQANVETSVVQAIVPGGANPLIFSGGIDVLHINHHGSESSTNPTYFNLAAPSLAVIGTGDGQSTGWDLPRIDVVDDVLLGSACVTAPNALVLQTEEGSPAGSGLSTSGYCVGNVIVTTDGRSTYTVDADGDVNQGPNEYAASGLPQIIDLDGFDLSGYKLVQANATLNYTFPSGTVIPNGGYVIVARNATKTQFEAFWGVTLGSNVVYINSADTMPQLNGSETYTLKDAGNVTIDGATYAHDSSSGDSLERTTCGSSGLAGTWTKVSAGSATPGSNGKTGCGLGVFINENSDAIGTGNFIYEFIELHSDR
ncbi:MAG TPA: lamin tail domain-containing protein [Thermoanaerobaculia bacterium]|nr:lamin tail domain-containing protein [Thermoanaerobaculia bacterium]